MTRRTLPALVVTVTCAALLAACGSSSSGGQQAAGTPSPGTSTTSASGGGTAHVLYAGSLVGLMEDHVGPAFEQATGDGYQGFGAGSTEVASDIKGKVQTGDVFVSASPTVNASLEGASNGDWVSWYASFAKAPLVIGYNPKSSFATDLKTMPWYKAITQSGVTVGRTDPTLDPKGALTVTALQAAQSDYHLSGFASQVEKNSQVYPEQELVARLQSGQVDCGFFYTNEAVPLKIPTVTLGKVQEAATFTVTVLNHAPDAAAGARFVAYLLGPARSLLTASGLQLQPYTVSGDTGAVPSSLSGVLSGSSSG